MQKLNLTLYGDYFVGDKYCEFELKKLYNYLKSNKLNVINYEGSFGTPISKSMPLIMSDQSLKLPKNVILALSNNHVFDGGYAGFNILKENLEKKKISYFGIESKKYNCDNFTIINKFGKNICFAGFGWKNEECLLSQTMYPGIKNLTKKNLEIFF